MQSKTNVSISVNSLWEVQVLVSGFFEMSIYWNRKSCDEINCLRFGCKREDVSLWLRILGNTLTPT